MGSHTNREVVAFDTTPAGNGTSAVACALADVTPALSSRLRIFVNVFVIAILASFGSFPLLAATIDVAGRQLVVIQPGGYCWLDMIGSERHMATQAAVILSRTGQELLAMFGECGELKRLRSGKVATLNSHGSFTADRNRAGIVVPTKRTRHDEISQTVAQLSKASAYSADSLSNLKQMANQALPGTLLEMSTPRVISQDSNAVYVAGIANTRSSLGVNRLIATVTSTTVLQGVVINVILHADAKSDPYDFSSLLQRSKTLAAELVRVNP